MSKLTAIIIAIVILFPAYMVILSMAAYVGKVWTIRLIFNKNKRSEFHGEEER